jgi:HAD superfamily hydrolase (TIGR01509 family)
LADRLCSLKAVFFDLGGTLWAPFGDLGMDQVICSAALAAAGKAGPEELAPRLASDLVERLSALRDAREKAAPVSFADPAFREEDLAAVVADVLSVLMAGIGDAEALPEVGEVTREQLSDIARQFGHDLTKHYRLFPDTIPALQTLRAVRPNVTLAIVSNTAIQPDIVDFYLAECGLDRLVGFRVLSSEVGWRKPHPAIYAAALAQAGVRPEEALFVGDRPVEDVAGPKRLGMRAVLCRFDGDAEPLPSWATPDAVVPDLLSLFRLLGEPGV